MIASDYLVIGGAAVLLILLLLYLILRRGGDRTPADLLEKIRTFEEACQLTRDALIIVDRSRQIIFANQEAQKLASIEPGEPLSSLDEQLGFTLPEKGKRLTLDQMIQRHRSFNTTGRSSFHKLIPDNREEGALFEMEISTVRSTLSRQAYDIIMIHDRSSDAKLIRIHHVHPMTGMPNQFKAFSDITQLTAKSGNTGRFALLMIELDNLPSLRSVLGYAEIDNIIALTATVLKEMQSDDSRISVYHLSYINFMILLRNPGSDEEISALFHSFLQRLQEQYSMRGKNFPINYSAGVSIYPNHGTLSNLINSAYGALEKARARGQGQILIAGDEFEAQIDRELQLNSEIERGLQEEEFKLYFQPIYDAREQKLIGAEALLRWHHPERGIVMPNTFIPVAEQSGIIVEIGQYVIRESLKLLHSWSTFDFPPLKISLNLSLRDLEYTDFIPRLTEMLYQYNLGNNELRFEITEHTSMINPEFTRKRLQEVRQLGISVALDDFGTGYSSFSHLAQFPIQILKIDREFVRDISRNPGHQQIVKSMIKLGHSLGMSVVAEGVESKEDVETVTRMGADYLQGFHFSRPLPKLEFQYLLTHGRQESL
ncbi:putative bifunctional diguanylate cyclase/phosphodiesterase [Nitratifractor sp.]